LLHIFTEKEHFPQGSELLIFSSNEVGKQPMRNRSSHHNGVFEPGIERAASRVAVIYRPIAELKRAPKNPRLHTPKQIRQIAESLKTFGFLVPLLVDDKDNMIAGHGRIRAAEILGLR
jgi:integrase